MICEELTCKATAQPECHYALRRDPLMGFLIVVREDGVVVAPGERWAGLDGQTMQKLRAALDRTTAWQRADARQREAAALAELQRMGMTIYEVDEAEREAFRQPLPDLAGLLPDTLDAKTRKELVRLASAGAAAVTGTVGGAAAAQPRDDTAPGADARQGDQRDH